MPYRHSETIPEQPMCTDKAPIYLSLPQFDTALSLFPTFTSFQYTPTTYRPDEAAKNVDWDMSIGSISP